MWTYPVPPSTCPLPSEGRSVDTQPLSHQMDGQARLWNEPGAAPPGRTPTPTRRRRWPWVAAVVVLAVAAASGAGLAWHNADRAAAWQEAAEDLRDERDSTAAALKDTEDELADTKQSLQQETERLARARNRVGTLEDRVRTLANEKATVEDEREVAEGFADTMAALAVEANQVGEQLDECINRTSSWLASTPGYYDSEWVWDSWGYEGQDVGGYCGEAQGAFNSFRARLSP